MLAFMSVQAVRDSASEAGDDCCFRWLRRAERQMARRVGRLSRKRLIAGGDGPDWEGEQLSQQGQSVLGKMT